MPQRDSNSQNVTGSVLNLVSPKSPTAGVANSQPIRFEAERKTYVWIHPEHILFIKSADHYVKALVQHANQKKWTMRHCTIKDLIAVLNYNQFIRLNKFYMINRAYFSHMDETGKMLILNDGFSIPVCHNISRFVIRLLKS
jgi:DNA-binding LytR/AlgR family response regulator